MPLLKTLSRTLRARDDDSASDPYSDELEGSSPSVLDTGAGGEDPGSDSGSSTAEGSDEADDDEPSNSDSEDAREKAKQQLSSISFGTLAKVQDSLAQEGYTSRKRKRGADASAEQEEKLQALRQRLSEIRASKGIISSSTEEKGGKAGVKKPSKDAVKPSRQRDEASDDDEEEERSASSGSDEEDDSDVASDSDDEPDTTTRQPKRSSKHAPTSQSSKRAVSRKRAVVPVATRKVRDPRFEPLPGSFFSSSLASSSTVAAAAAARKNYAFLKEYQSSEMAELRAAIKKTKDEAAKEALKRKLLSMESRRKADEAKEKQAEVLREHRRKEREAVRRGKKPFFLKRSEVKKQVLVNTFEGMKGKERERAIERRRKKVASKERRGMPGARRGVES